MMMVMTMTMMIYDNDGLAVLERTEFTITHTSKCCRGHLHISKTADLTFKVPYIPEICKDSISLREKYFLAEFPVGSYILLKKKNKGLYYKTLGHLSCSSTFPLVIFAIFPFSLLKEETKNM